MPADPLRYFRIEARELVDQISAGSSTWTRSPGRSWWRGCSGTRTRSRARPGWCASRRSRITRTRSKRCWSRTGTRTYACPPRTCGSCCASTTPSRRESPSWHRRRARPRPPEPPRRRPEPPARPRPIRRRRHRSPAPPPPMWTNCSTRSARRTPGSRPCASADRRSTGSTVSAESLADQLRIGRSGGAPQAARASALRLATELGTLGRRLTDAVEQVERELDELRGRAERLRLVAAATIFTTLHRAVRDAADAQGKRVRFEGRGGELRMDPQVLAQVGGAFGHVVRNAVAHGIEPEADRVAAGKPAEGRVVVEVERRGRRAAFRCTDDGRGFDLAALRRAAHDRGMLSPGAGDDGILMDLVLRGGISTSATVTEVSGRGVGLDVVRDVAAQLGGEVQVSTRPGEGATVELVVPLTMLSLHGLVLEAAGTVATVPLDAVQMCVRLAPELAASAVATGRLAHDGRAVPFLPLARALYAGTAIPDSAAPSVAAVVSADGMSVAVGVDRLAGTSTLVVRPLPDLAPAAPVIAGVAMDLDGRPRLVLDVHGLVVEADSADGAAASDAEPVHRPPILVVDDSLTTRMLERSILESAGYEVDLAASGEEGLALAGQREYGLFLTDIDMPGIDGFEFVARTRADPRLDRVPAILVSSRASAEDRQRGSEVGASAYVVKGEFNQEELLAHIRRLISGAAP